MAISHKSSLQKVISIQVPKCGNYYKVVIIAGPKPGPKVQPKKFSLYNGDLQWGFNALNIVILFITSHLDFIQLKNPIISIHENKVRITKL